MQEDTFHLGIKALIRNETGRILLFRVNPKELSGENPAYWDLVGGRIQRGETVIDALQREVHEETGIKSFDLGKHLGMVLSNIRIPLKNAFDIGLILSIYECRITGEPQIMLSHEHTRYDWIEPAQAAEHLAFKYPEEFCRMVAQLTHNP